MPHPEHAVEDADRADHRRAGVLHLGADAAGRHEWPLDTVKHAEATPEAEQPYRELGLKQDEYERIREILGRRPTSSELAMYSVMWSEHCSYKSSQGAPAAVRREGPDRPTRCSSASARTPVSSTSARARRSPSRSSRTTTRRTSSPTRARPPASAASCATSCRWARGRSRSWTRCGSARPTPRTPGGCCPASSRASAATATASGCRTSAARSSSTRRTPATRSSTRCASA